MAIVSTLGEPLARELLAAPLIAGADNVTLVIVPERAAPFDETASAAAHELRESGEFVATRGIR